MYLSSPRLSTQRLLVRMADYRDVPKIAQYYVDNRTFLAPFEPTRPEEFFTEEFWRSQVERNLIEFDYGQSLRLFAFEQKPPRAIVGIINFTQFSKAPSYSCVVGYSLAENRQGKGYMKEALSTAIQHLFDALNYHRIMANYMPHNQRSGNLLKKLGFVVEGYARDYLQINGKWEDHILTSLINPDWKED